MGRVIVVQFVSVDEVVQDPNGSQGFERGGWTFRYGPQAVAGGKFKLGPLLDSGALLMGRKTWQQFARIWPSRSDEFSTRMNSIPKLVASRSLELKYDAIEALHAEGEDVPEEFIAHLSPVAWSR